MKGSIIGAIVLLAWDVASFGSFVVSGVVCPIWFVFSVGKNTGQRPGWRLAFLRVATPAVTLGIALANASVQDRIAEANAARIIKACEDFHGAHNEFPKSLDELVPQYLPSIPRAKYCLVYGEFLYFYMEGRPILLWHVLPPYGRKHYNFTEKRWGYTD